MKRTTVTLPSQTTTTLLLLMLLLLSTITTTTTVVLAQSSTERNIHIMNESGRRVEVHWIHPDTGELVLQSTPDILNGASFSLNSFVGHSFEVNELVS